MRPNGYSPPDSSVYGISRARILEWVAISFSWGSSGQGSNPGILHCRQILYRLSHQGSHMYVFFFGNMSIYTYLSKRLRRRRWHPTAVLLPGKSHGWRILAGCSPWGREESDTTQRLHFYFSLHALEKEMATLFSVLAWRISG